MFQRGSRYYKLPLISQPDENGVPVSSVALRPFEPAQGAFQHTVNGNDRLDLLAFRYYNDPVRWWNIADGNPDFPFPPDLIDTYPVRTEEIAVEPADYLERKENLAIVLAGLGPLFRNSESLAQATFTLEYTVANTRALAIAQIQQAGFRLLSSHAWQAGAATREAFTFSDLSISESWKNLLDSLASLAGVRDVASIAAAERFRIVYLETQVAPEVIAGRIALAGFVQNYLASQTIGRLGAQILIPQSQG